MCVFQSIAVLALIRTSSVRLCCPGDGGSPFSIEERKKKINKAQKNRLQHF